MAAEARRETRLGLSAAALPRVRSALGRVVVVFCVAAFVQAIPSVVRQAPAFAPVALALGVGALGLLLVAAAITAVLGRGMRPPLGVFAASVVLGLAVWPITVHAEVVGPDDPWLAGLVPGAAAAATIAAGRAVGGAVVLASGSLLVLDRLGATGGGPAARDVLVDALLVVTIGGAIVIVIATLIDRAQQSDRERRAALLRFREAARSEAVEAERAQVDALVHDTVLTTLLAASGARSAEERALVVRMAQDATDRLAAAAESDPAPARGVSRPELAQRLAEIARSLRPPFDVDLRVRGETTIPAAAADAIRDAAVQAMRNSVQHAGEARRRLVIRDLGDGLRVEVVDDGAGFDPQRARRIRLGLRLSIVERMSGVGGRAELDSAPGEGTRVVLAWEPPAEAGDPASPAGSADPDSAGAPS